MYTLQMSHQIITYYIIRYIDYYIEMNIAYYLERGLERTKCEEMGTPKRHILG